MKTKDWRTLRTSVVGGAFLLVALAGCAGADSDTETDTGEAADTATETAGEDVAGEAAAGAEASEGTLLNPNLASEGELGAVPGLTPGAMAAIVEGRPFMDNLALDDAISGEVDEAGRETVYAHLWVPLNLNTASSDEIQLIPGVGDRMTHEFEEYRPYDGMARFRREMAKYVDDTEVERLASYVFVPIDLNTATDAEILAIPGVGDRMLHEFKEYRPYTSIEQFRREIGKYVDEAEVARLERYVTITGN